MMDIMDPDGSGEAGDPDPLENLKAICLRKNICPDPAGKKSQSYQASIQYLDIIDPQA